MKITQPISHFLAHKFSCRTEEKLQEVLWKTAIDDLEILSIVGNISWIIPLLAFKHLFATFPAFYAGMSLIFTEHEWASIIGFLAILQTFSLYRKALGLRFVSFFLGLFHWFFLASFIKSLVPTGIFGLPAAPGVYLFYFFSFSCFVGVFRLAVFNEEHLKEIFKLIRTTQRSAEALEPAI